MQQARHISPMHTSTTHDDSSPSVAAHSSLNVVVPVSAHASPSK